MDSIIDHLFKTLKSYGLIPIFYIDRLHIYLDASTTRSDLKQLGILDDSSDLQKNKLLYQDLPHHPNLCRKLELFQPSNKQLLLLKSLIRGDYLINYLELACDLTGTEGVLKKLIGFLKKHLVYVAKNKSFEYCFYKSTRYFATRKTNKVFTLYAMSSSKVRKSKNCWHLEWRFQGIEKIKELEVITIAQLLKLDHQDFWNKHLDIRYPIFCTLGEMCSTKKRATTRQADTDRGKKAWPEITVLQKYLKNNPKLIKAFPQIDSKSRLEEWIKRYFDN